MSVLIKNWDDGSGEHFSIDPSTGQPGQSVVQVISDYNYGLDRTSTIIVESENDGSEEVEVIQIGLREMFICTDGPFLVKGDDTFNVLKKR